MKKVISIFFSMSTMGALILLFAAAIASATFIENDFGATAAQAIVYHAFWFEGLLVLLVINLLGIIVTKKLYRMKNPGSFIFHLSFLIILLGAALTRFVGFEGVMHLREGEISGTMLSDRTYVVVKATDDNKSVTIIKQVLLSALSPTAYHNKLYLGNKKISFRAVQFIPNAMKRISESRSGKPVVTMVVSANGYRKTLLLTLGETSTIGNYRIRFGNDLNKTSVNLVLKDGQLKIIAPDTIRTVSMTGDRQEALIPFKPHPLNKGMLYTLGKLNLVLTQLYPNAHITYMSSRNKNANLKDVLLVRVRSDNAVKKIALYGGKGYVGEDNNFNLNGVHLTMSYGARKMQLPFAVKLNDFQMDRYPGSMSPSGYVSQVTVMDKTGKVIMPYNIYMNHVLNYKGYRFFQSSYDRDEQGSILSVNHDSWGTGFTYLGYLLMSLGMVWALLSRKSRFYALGRKLKQTSLKVKTTLNVFLILMTIGSTTMFAQHKPLSVDKIPKISKIQATKFGRLVVQTNDGRIKPVNSLSSELLRKLSWKNSFHDLNSDEVLLGMLSFPWYWQQLPMIKVGDKNIAKILGIKGKQASYIDFFDMNTGNYKLQKAISHVYETKPSRRSRQDKELMKVDERMNISYMIYSGEILKMIPDTRSVNRSWYSLKSKQKGITAEDSVMIKVIFPQYFHAISSGNVHVADRLIEKIVVFQNKYAGPVMPSVQKINAEILYNKWMIFDRLGMLYGIIGILMLVLLFVDILKAIKFIKNSMKFLLAIVIVGFILQTFGLGLRWYISGHAPWSDGYESMVYIGWVTMLAGLLFSRRSMITVAATTVLSAVILMVAHLSWMDPEITNLVPVLKSYWLTIHVSIITASYGFLALSMLLGFFNLVLVIMQTPKNIKNLTKQINTLTIINERSLIIGLYMLTIGTFIGGVWANESWGRYWGWDPKEAWALISVLIYAFIAHMRYIPGLKSKFSFNLASLLGYSSILMTFFGVNYYLSGLHSYAKGDSVPVPSFVYISFFIVLIVAVWAGIKEKKDYFYNQ